MAFFGFGKKARKAVQEVKKMENRDAVEATVWGAYSIAYSDGTFSCYHTAGFTEDDQYHLASILERRSSEGHPVIVSNSDTSLTRSLYRNFTRHRITAKRSMGVAAGESKSAAEIIATKSAGWFGVDLASGPDISVETEVRAWQ